MKDYKKNIALNLILVLLTAICIFFSPALIEHVDRNLFDTSIRMSARPDGDNRIVIVQIDEKSLATLGPWPWKRSIHAALINRLNKAGVKVIAFDIFYQTNKFPAASSTEPNIDSQDHTLIGTIQSAGNVILPDYYQLKQSRQAPNESRLADKFNSDIRVIEDKDLLDRYPTIAAVKRYASLNTPDPSKLVQGHINKYIDSDGIVRKEILFLNYKNHYMPCLGLKVVQSFWQVSDDKVVMVGSKGVRLGSHFVPLNPELIEQTMVYGLLTIRYHSSQPPYPSLSYTDILEDRFPIETVQDKIVLVGATAPGLFDTLHTPVNVSLPGIYKHATVIDNLLNNDFIRKPVIMTAIVTMIWFIVSVVLAVGFAMIRPKALMILSTAILVGSLILQYGLLRLNLWLPFYYFGISAVLLGGTTLFFTYFRTRVSQRKLSETNAEVLKDLALSYQARGELENAFHTFSKLDLDPEIMELMYHLAVQLEKVRKNSLADHIYHRIFQKDPAFKDVAARFQKDHSLFEQLELHPGKKPDTKPVSQPATARPDSGVSFLKAGQLLGRYEIIKMLGSGAMGEVYMAHDPKLDRMVAVKTYRLKNIFYESELETIRKELFTEAQTAGKLNHPNIVSIFDIGRDWDFSYIVMEFVKGTELSQFCHPNHLLPKIKVLEIMMDIAGAVAHIHQNGIIHRDIKPANIMLLQNGHVKIMDFGVAFTVDQCSDKNMVIGTPMYMSPEQISGQPIDGRSDLYSLGLVFYELLTGMKAHRAKTIKEMISVKHQQSSLRLNQHPFKGAEYIQPIVDKLVARDRTQRYENSQAFVADVKNILRMKIDW